MLVILTHHLSPSAVKLPPHPLPRTLRRPKQPVSSRRSGLPVSRRPLRFSNRRGAIATPLPSTATTLSEPLASLRLRLSQLLHQTAAQVGARVDLKRLAKLRRTLAYQALEVFMTQTESAAEDIQGRLPRVWTSEVVFAGQLDSLRLQCGYSRAAFDRAYGDLRAQGVIVVRPVSGGRQMRVCLKSAA